MIKRFLALLWVLSLFVNAASANTSAAARVGEALRAMMKNNVAGQNGKAFFKNLSDEQKSGLRILLKHAEMRRGADALANIHKHLDGIDLALKHHSEYKIGIKEFLDRVHKLDALAMSAHDKEEVAKMVAGCLPKSSFAATNKGSMNNVKGAVAEIIEIVEAKDAVGSISSVQPRLLNDSRLFREAELSGGPIAGKWYLEVKNYFSAPVEVGRKHLRAQIASHFRRLSEHDELTEETAGTWPGLYFRFAGHGGSSATLQAFEVTIKNSVKDKFIKTILAMDPEITPAKAEELATTYVENRVRISSVTSQY